MARVLISYIYSITRRQDGQHRQGGHHGGGRVVSRRRLQLAPVPDGALDTRLGPASHPPPLPGLPSTLATVCLHAKMTFLY